MKAIVCLDMFQSGCRNKTVATKSITVVFKINQARDCGKEMIEEDEYAWYQKTGCIIA